MKRIWAQCVKELAQFRRDRLTVALAYVLPFVAVVIYGFATRLESKDIPVCVRNYDVGQLSREYVSTLFANGQLVDKRWIGKDAYAPLDLGVAKATVTIPPEFSREVKQGRGAPIQVIVDATDVNNARVVKNSIIATTNFFLSSKKVNPTRPLITEQIRLWFNPGRKESLYIAPGAIAVFLWIFPCLLAALAMSREKEQGTMLQLYASSLTSFELVAGKALAYLLIGITQAIFLVASSMLLFQLRLEGDFFAFAVITILYLCCGVCFGLMAGSRANSQSAAVQICSTAGFTTALLLSGFLYPLRNITYPLSLLSNIIPARYYIEATRDFFVRGSDAFSQLHMFVALLLCALVLYMSTSRILRRMQLSE